MKEGAHSYLYRIDYLGVRRWEVWRSPSLEVEDHGLYGVTLYPVRRIVIDMDLSPYDEHWTLAHEYIHAISYEYDLDLEEQVVRILENGLQQMTEGKILR